MKKILVLLCVLPFASTLALADVGVKKNDTSIARTQSMTSVTEHATDLNVVGASQMYTDGSTVTIDLTSVAATGGTINNVNIGAVTPAPATFTTLQYTTPVSVITTSAATTGAITLAKTGYMYVLQPAGEAVSGAGYTLTLPSTNSTVSGSFSGETYIISTGSSSTISLRTASATDATIYYGANNCTRITSPASSGATVTVVGYGRAWYIRSMSNGRTDVGANWSTGSF